MDKTKYIKDAIAWRRYRAPIDGMKGIWVRCSEMNLSTFYGKDGYVSACFGYPMVIFRTVFPYEEWMEEYIGTDRNLREDERLMK